MFFKRPKAGFELIPESVQNLDSVRGSKYENPSKKMSSSPTRDPETNSHRPCKWMVGSWNTISFPLGFRPIFRGVSRLLVLGSGKLLYHSVFFFDFVQLGDAKVSSTASLF